MGIAEQMGRVLQRTSISVNIKERLDFSCALFGPDGAPADWMAGGCVDRYRVRDLVRSLRRQPTHLQQYQSVD
jgi:hypothetical protein